MKLNHLLIFLTLATKAAMAGGEGPGHAHGPDGRHIVTVDERQGQSGYVLSHHDMKVLTEDGKPVLNVVIDSTIYRAGKPEEVVHRERNAYEPENGVYGSHMTYQEEGDYVLSQAVAMPDGRKLNVEFPIFARAESETAASTAAKPAISPVMVGIGALVFLSGLYAAYRFGARNARQAGAVLLALCLSMGALTLRSATAGEEGEGHAHGPAGRHILTDAGAQQAGAPKILAYASGDLKLDASKTVDGITFVLSIENETIEPDPSVVYLTEAEASKIGLETAQATQSAAASSLQATGQISASPDGIVTVNAIASGKIVALKAIPGTEIRKGQPLAIIESAELADAQAEYRSANVQITDAQSGIEVGKAALAQALAELQIAEQTWASQRKLAELGEFDAPSLERARKEHAMAVAQHKALKAQQSTLASLLERQRRGFQSGVVSRNDLEATEANLAETASKVEEAVQNESISKAALQREEDIARGGLRTSKELEAAAGAVIIARSRVRSLQSEQSQHRARLEKAQSALRLAQVRIAQLGGAPNQVSQVIVSAPISGEVERRTVSVGETVAVGQPLFELLNADVVWVLADLYEKDIPKVRVGQPVEIVADAHPDLLFKGRVSFIHKEVNPETRTTPVRIVIDNPGEILKQHMFVRVTIGDNDTLAVTVPASAVQRQGGIDYVFVKEGDRSFRKTIVRTLVRRDSRTVVEGLKPGQTVATAGSYQLLALAGR